MTTTTLPVDESSALLEKPSPATIPMADLYAVSNIALRLQNIALQQELLRRDHEAAQRELQAATLEINRKYGLDPVTQRVLPDGRIVSVDSPLLPRL